MFIFFVGRNFCVDSLKDIVFFVDVYFFGLNFYVDFGSFNLVVNLCFFICKYFVFKEIRRF